MLDRHDIQNFVDVIYDKYKTIVFSAPTGVGRDIFFIKSMVDDMLKSPKHCLFMSDLSQYLKQGNRLFMDQISMMGTDIEGKSPHFYSIVENRSDSHIQFKNGSLIEFRHSKQLQLKKDEEMDVIYISATVKRDNYMFYYYLFDSFKKIIVVDDNLSLELEKIMNEVKINHKPIYIFQYGKNDILTEIRHFKLKKVMDKCIH
jgi:hypothetical protein